jgi:UDP-N-acetyl-D-galactosamine dehydrogenase
VDIFDPWASPEEIKAEYGEVSIRDIAELSGRKYDAVVLAVAHKEFVEIDVKSFCEDNAVVFDIKGILPRNIVTGRL